jgi:hypothetical protein
MGTSYISSGDSWVALIKGDPDFFNTGKIEMD